MPFTVCVMLLYLDPLLGFHSPHKWITQSPMYYATHTPRAESQLPPRLPGEQWLRVNIIGWRGQGAAGLGDEQSGLWCFEEAADAQCNTTSAEHELHGAQCCLSHHSNCSTAFNGVAASDIQLFFIVHWQSCAGGFQWLRYCSIAKKHSYWYIFTFTLLMHDSWLLFFIVQCPTIGSHRL